MRLGDERGSVLPLVAVWLAVLVLAAMGLVAGVDGMVRRARAQAAADAGALAGAAGGRTAAELVVERNGAEVIGYDERQGLSTGSLVVVDIEVVFDGAVAEARAERFMESQGFP